MARLLPPGVRVTRRSSRWCGRERWRSREARAATRLPDGGQSMTDQKQLLHMVFGGELQSLDSVEFKDLEKLDIVGVFPNYAAAYAAWKGRAQRTVDNALMRYFIVHMHRL